MKKCLHGVPKVSPSVETMANDYLKKYATKEEACKAMLCNQIVKCTSKNDKAFLGVYKWEKI